MKNTSIVFWDSKYNLSNYSNMRNFGRNLIISTVHEPKWNVCNYIIFITTRKLWDSSLCDFICDFFRGGFVIGFLLISGKNNYVTNVLTFHAHRMRLSPSSWVNRTFLTNSSSFKFSLSFLCYIKKISKTRLSNILIYN